MIRTSPIVPSEFFLKGLSLFSHLWTVFAIGSNRNVSGSPLEPFGETNLATHEVISYGWVEASVNSLWSGLGWRQGGGGLFLRATLLSAINLLTQLGRERAQPSLNTAEIWSVTRTPRIHLIGVQSTDFNCK